MEKSTVYDHHRGLPAGESARLQRAAGGQERRILNIINNHPRFPYAYFEIIDITGFDRDSVRRSLSNLSGSANHERYLDDYGNWPVIYDKDRRKTNPNSQTSCGTYRANPIYGRRPPESGPDQQSELFGAPEQQHQNGMML